VTEAELFNDFDGIIGALHFTSPADNAFFWFHGHSLSPLKLKDFHGANVNTRSIPVTFL